MSDKKVELKDKELDNVIGGASSNAKGRCELKVQQINDPKTVTCKWFASKGGSGSVCFNCSHYMG